MKKIDVLIDAWMRDEATEEQVRQLFAWVRASSENAKEFARATSLHSDLRTYFSGKRNIIEVGEQPLVVPVEPSARASQRRLWSISASVAACVMLVTGLGLLFVHVETGSTGSNAVMTEEPSRASEPFVTVAQTDQAEWERAASLHPGDRIASEVLLLRRGTARLLFDDGVEVTLRGPSEFDLITRGSTRLASGLLTATVPPGAEGFRVETPSAEVFDLGTAFGVRVSDSGDSHVSVFDGAVHVFPMNGMSGQMLAAGEQVEIAAGSDIKNQEFDSQPFEGLWPVSSGITASAGAVRFTSSWRHSTNAAADSSEIRVEPEGYATILSQPLKLDVTASGEVSGTSPLQEKELSANRRVRSFLVQFRPGNSAQSRERMTGSVTFHRDVLGLIVKQDSLAASHPKFSHSRLSAPGHEADFAAGQTGHAVSLSDDRRTVSFDVPDTGEQTGQLRVIVDDSWSEIEETGIALSSIGASDSQPPAGENIRSTHPTNPAFADHQPPDERMLHPGHMRLMRSRDFDRDGKISRDEFPPHMSPFFHRLDLDGDGFVTPDELGRSRRRPGMPHGPHPGRHPPPHGDAMHRRPFDQ